jgi:hypothetical protein
MILYYKNAWGTNSQRESLVEAEYMVQVLAIEGFLLTSYRRKTLFNTSFENGCFSNGFSAPVTGP